MAKATNKILSVLQSSVLLLLILYVSLTALPQAFGITNGVVLSGSMEPEIATGSMCYIRKAESESISEGDVIAFYVGDRDLGMEVVHRVTARDDDLRQFTTKGDSNAAQDPSPVSYDAVIGIVAWSVPYLGYISTWISGHYALIAVGLVLTVFFQTVSAKAWKETADNGGQRTVD